MDEAALRQQMSRYEYYHIIPLTADLSTPGNPAHVPGQNLCMKQLKLLDLNGKRVLDIGCRDGLFSFAAEQGGAAEVIGIDNDLSKAAIEFLIPFFDSRVKMRKMNLYSITPENIGIFDVVIFAGVLYHLRYPFWGLKAIRDVMKIGSQLLIETAVWKGESHNALLFCPVGNDSPYEPTSCTFFNEKGLVDTLGSMGFTLQSLEYLRRIGPEFTLKNRALRALKSLIDTDWDGPPVSPRKVTRCVIQCEFRGIESDSLVTQYWEKTHEYHSSHGG
jgi:SAM-dependent methyltransferase